MLSTFCSLFHLILLKIPWISVFIIAILHMMKLRLGEDTRSASHRELQWARTSVCSGAYGKSHSDIPI